MGKPKERMMNMNKDDHNGNMKRERLIMISTSALVLTVLTVTGAYVRNHNRSSMDDGYTLDFTALEERADDKVREITKNSGDDLGGSVVKEETKSILDLPVRVDSDEVTIPGITEQVKGGKSKGNVDQSGSKGMSDGAAEAGKSLGTVLENKPVSDVLPEQAEMHEEQIALTVTSTQVPQITQTASDIAVVSEETLHFTAEQLVRPVSGEPLIKYSMDSSVYFATLDQYKYNPAMIYEAAQGEGVLACGRGRVINVHKDPELGHVVVLDLGDGYQAVYGQVDNIEIPIGKTVEAGTRLATVAAPTKYFSVEGSNLYFQLLKDGECIDPSLFF